MADDDLRHRPIRDLIGGTFGVVGRRFREVAVIAIVAAAVAVVSVAAVVSALDIVGDEVFENPRFEEFMDLTAQEDVASEEIEASLEAWLDSIEGNRLVNAALLFAVSLLVSLLGWATTIAFSLVALDDVEGRNTAIGRSLGTGLARVPKAVLLAIIYFAVFVVLLIALGIAMFVLSLMHPYLGIAAFFLGIVGTVVYFAPLVQMHYVMAYLEPGFPSWRKWWRLIAGNKAATWGRSALIVSANIAVGLILWFGLLALPSPYGDFISNAIAGPILGALSAIAYALMYADLSGRSRPGTGEMPELGD
ncbi:hypothetical protein [Candidatus Poriferisodalis sp.]|uniref:hypothetical protein n=1 Tax=Candidatus Poriferisodalis sp. TaxID=3101277 RepID=UPI003B0248C4